MHSGLIRLAQNQVAIKKALTITTKLLAFLTIGSLPGICWAATFNDIAGNPTTQQSNIDGTVSSIVREWDDPSVSTNDLERRLLSCLKDCRSDYDKAIVFSSLAEMFGSRELRIDRKKSFDYSKKVVELKISDPKMLSTAYSSIGGAICLMNIGAQGNDYARVRREAAEPYLKGIRILMDNKIPSKPITLPESPGFMNVLPGGPNEKQNKEKEKEYLRKVDEYNALAEANRLVPLRDHIIGQVVYIYSKEPYNPEELLSIAMQILDDKETVDEMMAQVDADMKGRLKHETAQTIKQDIQNMNQELLVVRRSNNVNIQNPDRTPIAVSLDHPSVKPASSASYLKMITGLVIMIIAAATVLALRTWKRYP